jgi:hypothetical protein
VPGILIHTDLRSTRRSQKNAKFYNMSVCLGVDTHKPNADLKQYLASNTEITLLVPHYWLCTKSEGHSQQSSTE